MMRLSAKEVVEAPIDFVWGQLSDFTLWERTALRRGVEMQRLDGAPTEGPGMAWLIRFGFQGKPREVDMRLAGAEPGQRLLFEAIGHSMKADLMLDLHEVALRRTRVTVVSEVRPLSMTARVFIQSLRLARGKLQEKYDRRIAGLAADIEDRWKARRSDTQG
ncbi:SRPBCC family protein [Cereibacter sphaeroides]|uniref:Polyketide cyclase/dehydrase/lipid transport protein n=2 Tax=Cereibacter azotoformans TaxID=43057 RepID=A0A2T5JXM3_9RHOB|nr:SRPBCC family protein [Cereibacter sphaeroides]PTR14914.1 polyketide cyclase/dehydrase/lipid transport protein [Cereibacter azotoformans]